MEDAKIYVLTLGNRLYQYGRRKNTTESKIGQMVKFQKMVLQISSGNFHSYDDYIDNYRDMV